MTTAKKLSAEAVGQLLVTMELFANINLAEIKPMLNCLGAQVKTYNKESRIIEVGENLKKVGILLQGQAQIGHEDFYGNQVIIDLLTPGDLFGEALVCAGVKKSPIAVVTNSWAEVLWLDFQRVVVSCTNACQFHHALITNLLRVIAKRNLLLNKKNDILSKRSIREKLRSYLMQQMVSVGGLAFDIPYNRNDLADYLCIDRSALSREISRMQQEALIKYDRNHFVIIDQDYFWLSD